MFGRRRSPRSRSSLIEHNDVELLCDGKEAFPSMLAAIGQAAQSISLETYIFADDKIGSTFRNALAAAARRGVDVRIIYDGIGCFDTDGSFWAALRDAGVELMEF